MIKKLIYGTVAISLFSMIQGCSTTQTGVDHSRPVSIASNAHVVVVPFYNTSNDAKAGTKAAIITASILSANNFNVSNIPFMEHHKVKDSHYKNMMARCEWARNHNISYIMKGSVNEWGYIASPKGSVPVVGMSMQLRDTSNCNVVWNAVGSKTAHSQMSVSGAAQKLIGHMLNSLNSNYKAS